MQPVRVRKSSKDEGKLEKYGILGDRTVSGRIVNLHRIPLAFRPRVAGARRQTRIYTARVAFYGNALSEVITRVRTNSRVRCATYARRRARQEVFEVQ